MELSGKKWGVESKPLLNEIFGKIDEGEEVITTVVHLSEVTNIFEDAVNLVFSPSFLRGVLMKKCSRRNNK